MRVTNNENLTTSQRVDQLLRAKFKQYFGTEIFNRYFAAGSYVIEEAYLIIKAPAVTVADAIRRSYLKDIQMICEAIWHGQQVKVSVTVSKENSKYDNCLFSQDGGNVIYSNFSQDKYHFSNFISHSSNALAVQAAKTVAGYEGAIMPSGVVCFIQGEVGLGKTHLAKAIDAEWRDQNRASLYLSAEGFVGDYIAAVKANNVFEFKKRVASYDLLLIDDIHSLAGKKSTSEELSNILCRMLDEGKNVVLTSVAKVSELTFLSGRLLSRIGAGINTTIAQPDLNLKKKIVNCIVSSKNIPVTLEAIDYMLRNINGNIREVKGALNRVGIASSLYKTVINVDMIRTILSDVLSAEDASANSHMMVNISGITSLVARHYGVSMLDIVSTLRTKSISRTRSIMMYVARNMLRMTYGEIAKYFGNRSHVAVIQACRKIEDEVLTDKALANEVDGLKKLIRMRYNL